MKFLDIGFLEQLRELGFYRCTFSKSVRPVKSIDLLRWLGAFLKENNSRKLQSIL